MGHVRDERSEARGAREIEKAVPCLTRPQPQPGPVTCDLGNFQGTQGTSEIESCSQGDSKQDGIDSANRSASFLTLSLAIQSAQPPQAAWLTSTRTWVSLLCMSPCMYPGMGASMHVDMDADVHGVRRTWLERRAGSEKDQVGR